MNEKITNMQGSGDSTTVVGAHDSAVPHQAMSDAKTYSAVPPGVGQALGADTESELAHTPVPRSLQLGLVIFVSVAIAGGYWWSQQSGLPKDRGGDSSVMAQKPPIEPEQVEGMVKTLQTKLQANPSDAVGWAMLARTFSVVGRTTEAVDAYAHAVKLQGDDAALLVDYADALAVKNGRSLEGEPLKLLTRALEVEPHNIKGLAMAGKYAFDHQDFTSAVRKWEQVVSQSPADNLFVQQISKDLATARVKAGVVVAGAGAARSDVAPGGGIQGAVTLAASLASTVSPEDTVFVTVRAVDGSRLPLAIIRKKAKDLPVSFQLGGVVSDPSKTPLPLPDKVQVTARITKTGSATPQGGDLVGQLGPIAVGSSGLILEIKDTYRP